MMKKTFLLLPLSLGMMLLTSCMEKKDYHFTPTIDLNVTGGTSGQANAPISTSSGSDYTPYQGGAYWGDEGKAANTHYTPYSEREHNYNHYRGEEE